MALRTPASWIQGGSHSAENDRLTERAGTLAAGIVGTGDLAVSANSTPNMSVNVAAGAAFVLGSITSTQGYYKAFNDAATNLAVTASNASNPRIDIVVVTINDAQYAGVTNSAVLQVIAGTPAGSPVPPSAPANSYILAQILVGAAVSSITNANITDKRVSVTQKSPVFQSDAASAVGLIVRGATAQTADLQQWQNSGGATQAAVRYDGLVYTPSFSDFMFNPATTATDTRMRVQPASAASIGLLIQGNTSQTGDLTQWLNSSAALIANVTSDGQAILNAVTVRPRAGTTSGDQVYQFVDSGGTMRALLAVPGIAARWCSAAGATDLVIRSEAGKFYFANGSGTALASIDASGNLTAANFQPGAWTAYTPTLTNFAGSVTHARYYQVGKMVTVQVLLTATGAATGTIKCTLPTAYLTNAGPAVGIATAWNGGTNQSVGVVLIDAVASTVSFANASGPWNATVPFALANGNTVAFTATYEAP